MGESEKAVGIWRVLDVTVWPLRHAFIWSAGIAGAFGLVLGLQVILEDGTDLKIVYEMRGLITLVGGITLMSVASWLDRLRYRNEVIGDERTRRLFYKAVLATVIFIECTEAFAVYLCQ